MIDKTSLSLQPKWLPTAIHLYIYIYIYTYKWHACAGSNNKKWQGRRKSEGGRDKRKEEETRGRWEEGEWRRKEEGGRRKKMASLHNNSRRFSCCTCLSRGDSLLLSASLHFWVKRSSSPSSSRSSPFPCSCHVPSSGLCDLCHVLWFEKGHHQTVPVHRHYVHGHLLHLGIY